MLQKQSNYYTTAEYLALEEAADYKSEYYRGEIFAMAGASANYNRIAGNLYAILNFGLESKPCEVFSSDMKLHVKQGELYTYPDIMVVCGRTKFVKDRTDTITNPNVIIEVLSTSTEAYDRGLKFELYRAIDTFQFYILIDQSRVHLDYYHKLPDGRWVLTEFKSADASLTIESLDLEIPIARIYRKVDWFAEERGNS
ncbi:MAG: Uma2 family endonuclease [Anaerolineae bacterium]|nr:Uma2 family endonuclease [Anaerolineae bacterium]